MLLLVLSSKLHGKGNAGLTISECASGTVSPMIMSSISWVDSEADIKLDIAPSPIVCVSSSLVNTIQCFSDVFGIVIVILLIHGLRRMTNSIALIYHRELSCESYFHPQSSSMSLMCR